MLSKLVNRKKVKPGPDNSAVGNVKPAGLLSRIKKGKVARSVSPLDRPPSRKQLFMDRLRAMPAKNKLLAVGLAILLVIVLVVAWRSLFSNNDQGEKAPSVTASYVCSERGSGTILSQAVDALDPTDPKKFKKLKGVVAKIKKLENHEKDPNCLYPIIRHHVAIADIDNAKAYYEKLAVVYDSSGGLANVYGVDLPTVKAMVDHLEVVRKEAEANTIYFNEPEER